MILFSKRLQSGLRANTTDVVFFDFECSVKELIAKKREEIEMPGF